MPKAAKLVNWSLLPTGDTWSPEYAWWLGLTFGDGCIDFKPSDYRYRISLSSNKAEQPTAEKWKALICPKAVIQDVSDNGIETVFYHSEFAQWFARAWWSGDKMANMRYPTGKIPKGVLRHWVRGLIDSDGGVHIYDRKKIGGRGNPVFSVDFSSSAPGFVASLAADLATEGLPEVSVQSSKKEDAATGKTFLAWRLRWTGSSALKVADWLYEGCSPDLRDDGRYAVYEAAKKQAAELLLPCVQCKAAPKLILATGLCRGCHEKTKPHQYDKPCSQCWLRRSVAKGVCVPCFKRNARSEAVKGKRVYGNCTVCSSKLTLKGVKKCAMCAKASWERTGLMG